MNLKNLNCPSGSSTESFLNSENQGFSDCLFFNKQGEKK